MSAEVETVETAVVEVPKDLQDRAAGVVAAYEAVSIDTLVERVNLLKELMKRCMVEGQHHGTIPGTKKPSLWKPGAELICTLFQLGTRYPKNSIRIERDNGHFLFTLTCELFHIPSGRVVGEGVGAGSTMEYRFRIQTEGRYSDHGQPIKAKYTPFDFYNTVLKMARKRSMIDAVLTACGASELWIQDVEDNPELYQDQDKHQQPARQSLPKPPPRISEAKAEEGQRERPDEGQAGACDRRCGKGLAERLPGHALLHVETEGRSPDPDQRSGTRRNLAGVRARRGFPGALRAQPETR